MTENKDEIIHSNRVLLRGEVEGKPEIRYYDNEHLRASLCLRTDIVWSHNEETQDIRSQWHKVIARDTIARQIEAYVHTSTLLEIEGVLFYRKEIDRCGISHLVAEVLCHKIVCIEGAGKEESNPHVSVESIVDDELLWHDFAPIGIEDPMV